MGEDLEYKGGTTEKDGGGGGGVAQREITTRGNKTGKSKQVRGSL